MAIVRKIILSPGVYHAPQGRLHATKSRVRKWEDTFRRMSSSGIRVPVCWGHQPGAIPGEGKDKATRQFELSRYNAGYVTKLATTSGGDLEAEMDIPGAELDDEGNLVTWAKMPDGRKLRCAIKEVSAAIRDWRDGSGREWPDAIMHVALVPLPVVAGQTGFEKTLGTDTETPGEIHLSLSTYLGATEGFSMPMIGAEVVDAGGGMDPVARAIGVLRRAGIPLPEDTNEANLCERISLVGGALDELGHLGGGEEPDGDEFMDEGGMEEMAEDELGDGEEEVVSEDGMDDELPMDDEEMPLDEEGMDDGGDDEFLDDDEETLGLDEEEDEDGEMEISGDSDGLPGERDDDEEDEDEDATEEPRPIMMSTTSGGKSRGLVARTKLEKTLVRQVERGILRQRLARVDELVSRGMPRHRAKQLREEVQRTPVQLTMRQGKIVPVESRVDVELSTLESVTAEGWSGSTGSTVGGKVKTAKRPKVTADDGRVSRKFIEQQAAKVSVKTRRGE